MSTDINHHVISLNPKISQKSSRTAHVDNTSSISQKRKKSLTNFLGGPVVCFHGGLWRAIKLSLYNLSLVHIYPYWFIMKLKHPLTLACSPNVALSRLIPSIQIWPRSSGKAIAALLTKISMPLYRDCIKIFRDIQDHI